MFSNQHYQHFNQIVLQPINRQFTYNAILIVAKDSAIENVSRALYQYLCQNIVGTEDHVKTIRMMNTVRDDVHSNKNCTIITSGSFGEGLEMRDSDVDIMFVMKELMVSEDTPVYFNADTIYFTMDTDYIQPGYTKLRLEHGKVPCEACEKTDNGFLEMFSVCDCDETVVLDVHVHVVLFASTVGTDTD
ncbi:unnamed protein product [Mytilus edulis]|uniref:Uncharacterized protein n=1 Tax=Mytilus edulis TaxID=6550 RepID=A0A8S3URE0_MYTED|nr:unnamed protein product [Mytilus edulis]